MSVQKERRAIPRPPLDPQPIPPGWHDDPDYVLAPYAVATFADTGAPPAQFGVIGTCTRGDEQIAVDTAGCFAHAYFGTPTSGKSYIEGVLLEAALSRNRYQNRLLHPLGGVAIAYGAGEGGRPAAEQFSARRPNSEPAEVRALRLLHGTLPQAIEDVLGMTTPRRVEALRAELSDCPVLPLQFSLQELGLQNLRRLMAMPDRSDSLLAEEIGDLCSALQRGAGRSELLAAIEAYPFRGAHLRGLARRRAQIACQSIEDGAELRSLVHPGRLLVVDLRDGWLGQQSATRHLQVLLDVLLHGPGRLSCNLLLCLDEAHKLLRHPELRLQIEHLIRERRHLRLSLVLLSQDPLSIPHSTLSELDGIGMFRTDSRRALSHLSRAVAPFADLRPEDTAALGLGQMYLWSRGWYERFRPGELSGKLVRLLVRPRMSQHGGATRGAAE